MTRMRRYRTRKGYTLAEAPAALWMTFVLLFFPLFCLVTCLIRYSFLLTAAHEAAYEAAISKTFSTDVSTTDLSATKTAQNIANNVANSFSGVSVKTVNTRIVRSDTQTSSIQVYTTKLPQPADTSRYVYVMETTVDGSILPIIQGHSTGLFGTIPGLTAPMEVQATSRKVAENPQGLNL